MNLRIKWPNDIYAGSQIKLGGLIVTTLVKSKNAICNIGKFLIILIINN